MSAAVVELLRAGRELVKRGWTQGTLARDANGGPVSAYDPTAVCFCAVGSVDTRDSWDEEGLAAFGGALELLEGALSADWGDSLGAFNDAPTTTQADVVALFDRAIAAAEAAS